MNVMKVLQTAQEAARAGGSVLAGYFQTGIEFRAKQACDFVSNADVESERAIARVIRDAFPEHDLLGEEGHQGDVNAEHLWVIDPLDGTTNFAHDIPHFAVSIGYYHKGEPLVAVIYNPAR